MRSLLLLLAAPVAWCASQYSLTTVLDHSGPLRTSTIPLRGLKPRQPYSFLFSIGRLRSLTASARVTVTLSQGGKTITGKTLHAGDADFYTDFRALANGPASIHIAATGASGNYHLVVNAWPAAAAVKREPDSRWEDANTIELGSTVFSSGDDSEYIPVPGTARKEFLEDSHGVDWYKFQFAAAKPKLVFFQIDLMERDNLPVDIAVFRLEGAKPVGYFEGEDPVALPHEVQALPGNKFTTRILKSQGIYLVRVRANHPEYKLRTRVFDPPPYTDPREAVSTALAYMMAAGDSWHANTPRRGGIFDRVSNVHQETSLCVACHPTHFTLRAQLYAKRNGYPILERQQVQFLTERFYNNPRPFYGFEDEATWARVISASANVLSRMSHLIDLFENDVSGERREAFHKGIAGYLNLYYKDRDKLPPDETNGNTPLVSAHEVAWYSWKVTKDPHIAELIAGGEVKNMIDLCYQTQALADIDRTKYQAQIARNVERILSMQRDDGQWSMRFEKNQPEVEFQTGHVLWALAAAGVPRDNPQVSKGLAYLLKRQQEFGGWMDPLQSFENFRTPFRETQMAVLALSAYYPGDNHAKGWNAPTVERLSSNPAELLKQLDNVWDQPSHDVLQQIETAASSNDPLIRQAAIEALGRLARPESLNAIASHLGDPSKLVQRTAAWAVRQIYSRHENVSPDTLLTALGSQNDRVRWGATRVFATHFSALARRPEFAKELARDIDDPISTVRMQAIKGLWQYWFWTPDTSSKELIEDTLLAAMAKPQEPWIDQNLRDAVYNLADENIRYLYNNWVPLLAKKEDRERVIRGRLAVEARLARKFSDVLERGTDRQRKVLLAGLAEFPLRRGDTYNLDADLGRPAPVIYNRIGNDIEQSVFFGESAERFAKALLPLLDSKDAEVRRLAVECSELVRPVRFADVNRIAGSPGANVAAVAHKIEALPDAPEVAKAFRPPASPGSRAGSSSTSPVRRKRKLDEAYFRGYVEPILTRRGKDGYACVHCHASHTLFNATWSTVMNVVDTDNPENSLILRKPNSSSETEGIVGSKTLSHGGGVRWEKNSPEYLTILEWIKGAKE